MQLTGRRRGLAFAAVGVLTVTPDAVLVRYADSTGGTVGLILCVKSALTGLVAALLVLLQFKGRLSEIAAGLRAGPYHLAVVTLFQALLQVGFPLSFLYTGAAKALLLIALNPLWAALLARLFLKERVLPATMIALVAALASVLLVFVPELLQPAESNATLPLANVTSAAAESTVAGDVIAIATGLGLACFLTATRWASKQRPEAMLSLTPMIANLLLGVGFLPWAIVDAVRVGAPSALFWAVLVADGVCLCVALVCVVLAPKHAPAADVALVLLLENLLGPLWVFLGFGEVPSLWTFIGGALLLATLAVHEVYLGLRAAGEETAAAPPPSAAGGASETKGTCSTLPVVEVASA